MEDLVRTLLKGPGEGGYLSIMDRVDIPFDDLQGFCSWNDKHYTRNCIVRTEGFELLLICYEPGQRTSIHDYDTEQAWVHPVVGSVVEERFELAPNGSIRKVSSALLDTGSVSTLRKGRSIHRYINHTDERSITLNLYARPLNKWTVYDEGSGGTRTDSSVAGPPAA
jgi:cysteine dioxygenase